MHRASSVETSSNHRFRVVAVVLLFLVSLSALAAGFSFVRDPSGGDIGISIDYLKTSPFRDFFVPGLILFFSNGVLGLIVAIQAIQKTTLWPKLLLIQGCILGGWIVIQVILVRDFNWMHAACLFISLIFLFIAGRFLNT
jgi:hypothetical protein